MLVYKNNFPREGAVKGQKFDGGEKLKAELLERGIIGEGNVVVTEVAPTSGPDPKVAELEAKVAELEAEKVGFLEGLDVQAAELEAANTKIAELEATITELTAPATPPVASAKAKK